MRTALALLASLLLVVPAPAGREAVVDDDATALNQKAKVALDEGRPADAVSLLEAALSRAPDDATLRGNLAWAHYQVGEAEKRALAVDRAAAAFQRAWETFDEEPAYGLHLASLRLRNFRLGEALAVVLDVLGKHPTVPEAHLLHGDVLALLDRLAESVAAYETAAELAEGDLARSAAEAADRTGRQLAVEAGYQTLRTGSFVLRAPQGTDHVSLVGVLQRARVEVLNAFSVTRPEPALVVLYPPAGFREVTGLHDWVGGVFDRKIRLPIADPRADAPTIEAAFRHEFTHLLVSEWSPRCPTFLNEGTAQLLEVGRGQGMERLLDGLARSGRERADVPALGDLPESFLGMSDRDAVELGYLTSFAFVDHVAEHHGLRTVVDWIRHTDALPVDEAYRRASGRTLEAEEALFRELLRTAR